MKNSQIQQPVYIPACTGGSKPLNQAPLKGGGGRGAAPPHGAEPGGASRQDAVLEDLAVVSHADQAERKRTDNDAFS